MRSCAEPAECRSATVRRRPTGFVHGLLMRAAVAAEGPKAQLGMLTLAYVVRRDETPIRPGKGKKYCSR